MDKTIVFEIWAPFACFRRGYTTTSIVTYPFPPRTTLIGIIAAILGYKRDSYYELLDTKNCRIALSMLNPLKKIKITKNLIDTKQGFIPSKILKAGKPLRTQIPMQLIKDPHYRIYFQHNNPEVYESLKNMLIHHKTVYTLSLGTSEMLANFKYIGEFDVREEKVKDRPVEIHSVIPMREEIDIFIENLRYGFVRLPNRMNEKRVILEFMDFVYELEARPIKIRKGVYWEVKELNQNIIFY